MTTRMKWDSNPCQRTRGTIRERFWRSVVKRGPNECWAWTGRSERGYGRLAHHRAHRLSFLIHGGTLISGDCVLHSCDNPICVNPRHLWKGTRVDNNADRVAKQRSARGERSGRAKLTRPAVEDIRTNYRRYTVPASTFAKRYGVTIRTVQHVLKGGCW